MAFTDYYEILGLPRFYPTREEIRDAFLNKVVELNASGEASPEARQALDDAYVTLSDAKKKRAYDEVLDRYVQAEAFAPKKPDTLDEITISRYDYVDEYTAKRTIYMSPLSKKVYDFLSEKVRRLKEISSRYPFTSKSDMEECCFFENCMLMLYNAFLCVYIDDYLLKDIMQFLDDGISIMALSYPVEGEEVIKEQLKYSFFTMKTNFLEAAACTKDEGETTFDYLAIAYIIYTASGNDITQKIEKPDFQEAFTSMRREVSEFWERFFDEKDFVT